MFFFTPFCPLVCVIEKLDDKFQLQNKVIFMDQWLQTNSAGNNVCDVCKKVANITVADSTLYLMSLLLQDAL